MATRALIAYLDADSARLTTTYNHYDGYPENLGTALENFFNSDTLAKDIANYGYISYIDPKNGEIEANNKQAPGFVQLPDNFNEAMMEIAAEVDAHGGDYGYIWDNENGEWITVKNNGIRGMAEDLEMELAHLKDKFAMMPERPDQTMEAYHVGDNKEVITKEAKVNLLTHIMMSLEKLKKSLDPIEMSNYTAYEESVMRDILSGDDRRFNQYLETDFDWEEDYKNYIMDRTDIDESFVHQMKYKAGIIK
jgi:hypothetical protein